MVIVNKRVGATY